MNGMMQLKIKAFGVTKEILGGKEIDFEIEGQTVAQLRKKLLSQYPALSGLKSIMIAVNNNYAEDDIILQATDEVALIPPVSGG
jgi:molybdopterin synthase sulfur carrier subunit